MPVAVLEQPRYEPDGKPRVAKFRRPEPPVFSDKSIEQRYNKGRLALAARIFHAEGWGVGCAVYMSTRDAIDPESIWMLPAGKNLAIMRSEDLLQIRLRDGKVMNSPSAALGYDLNAFVLHAAVYLARPDVGGIAQGHTPYAKAFSMQNKTISMIVQDSCTFHGKVPVLPFDVGVDAESRSGEVGQLLGQGKGFIMHNRGLMTVGAAIECAVSYYIRLENLCHAQLLCEAAIKGRGGQLVLVGDEEVKFTYDNTGSEHHAWMMALPYYQKQNRLTGGAMVV